MAMDESLVAMEQLSLVSLLKLGLVSEGAATEERQPGDGGIGG